MIKLFETRGGPVHVNFAQIECMKRVFAAPDYTLIRFASSSTVIVNETPEAIWDLIRAYLKGSPS